MIVVVAQDPPVDFEMILSSVGSLGGNILISDICFSIGTFLFLTFLFFFISHFPIPALRPTPASSDLILNEPCMYFYTHIRTTYYIHYITISTHRNYIQYHYHRAVFSFSV